MTRALVTGSTAGIGAEFARQLAAKHHDLVLVARNADRLEKIADELRSRYSIAVEVMVADLQLPTGIAAVEARVESRENPVDVLVNNAGYGLRHPFDENVIDDERRLLDLLVAVPMRLSHAALRQMLPRRSGTIINIASVAGFVPRGTYGAAKAWLLSFSRWASIAYRARGVTVTAVAPEFVRTEFHERMAVRSDTVPAFLWLDVSTVVRIALRDVARGKAVSVPTLRYRIIVGLGRVLPLRLAAAGALTAAPSHNG